MTVSDYFTMYNTVEESDDDLDLGSGGILLFPDLPGTNNDMKELAIAGGKDAILYVTDRNNMGHFNPAANQIWQQVNGALVGGTFSTEAYWNGNLYTGAVGDSIKAFPVRNALIEEQTSETAEAFAYPGALAGVSAEGTNEGILWAEENTTPMILHAFNATNLSEEIYDNNLAGARDQAGAAVRFTTPMVASGRVYVSAGEAISQKGQIFYRLESTGP